MRAMRSLILVALMASAVGAQTPATVPAGDADTGKRLFTAYYCYACHGTQGQGTSAGARLAPRPIAFAAFQRYLRQPSGQMPPYKATIVSDQNLADMYAFLRSVAVSKPAKEIPLLNQ